MRKLLAAFAMLVAAGVAMPAGASVPHFRASHQNGGQHFRASHGHQHNSVVVSRSRCGGPLVVTTWTPPGRLYRSGFGHFSRPAIVVTPGIHGGFGHHGVGGGFVHGRSSFHRGTTCSYNGSVGSNHAHNRNINWDKRSRVHSPRLSKSSDQD